MHWHVSIPANYSLAFLAGCAQLLRLLQGVLLHWLKRKLYKRCCGGVDPFSDSLLPSRRQGEDTRDRREGYTVGAVLDGYISFNAKGVINQRENVTWRRARLRLGYNQCAAVCIGAIRVVWWHLLQPCAYFASLYVFYDHLNSWQQSFAQLIAIREGVYILAVLACLVRYPAFLLPDLRVTWRQEDGGTFESIMYVLLPDKYLCACLPNVWPAGGEIVSLLRHTFCCCLTLPTAVCDVFAVVALIMGLVDGTLPLPLIVGYAFPAIAGVLFAAFFVYANCLRDCVFRCLS